MAVFLSREDRIRGPKVPMDVQGLVWFTDSSETEQETEAGFCGWKMKLFFSLGKEICKEGSGKGPVSLQVALLGEPGEGGVPLLGTFRDG